MKNVIRIIFCVTSLFVVTFVIPLIPILIFAEWLSSDNTLRQSFSNVNRKIGLYVRAN